MEKETVHKLTVRYYSGEASLHEVEVLKEYFSEGEGRMDDSVDAALFRMLAATPAEGSASEDFGLKNGAHGCFASEGEDCPEILISEIGKSAEEHFRTAVGRRRRFFPVIAASTAVAASVMLAVFVGRKDSGVPVDTFSDPAIARAEAVKALELMGTKLNYCIAYTVSNAEKAGVKAKETMEKIIEINQ